MTIDIRVTRRMAKLLQHMLDYKHIDSPVTGITAMYAGVGSGSFYPLITRLEYARLVDAEWEVLPEGETRRPRRRFYHLTDEGVDFATRAIAEHKNRKPWYKRLAKWVEDAADDVTGDD